MDQLQDYINNPKVSQSSEQVEYRRLGLIEGHLRYIIIGAVGGDHEPASKMFPRHDDWEDIIDNYKKTAPAGVYNPFQTSSAWLWMVSKRALVRNALQGIAIAIAGAIAFAVLVLSTQNIILSIFCHCVYYGYHSECACDYLFQSVRFRHR